MPVVDQTSPYTIGSIVNGVLIGENGELYLANGGHAVFDIATGRKTVDPSNFAVFQTNILDRAAFCAKRQIRYRHIIFPDKQSAIQAPLPFKNPVCLGELYEQKCSSAAQHILNLTQLFRRQDSKLFKTTDTHPTDLGLMLAAADIAETLTSCSKKDALTVLLAKPALPHRAAGDLGLRFAPPLEASEQKIVTDWPVAYFNNEVGFGNDGLIDIYLSPTALSCKRLLWFGDSFGRGCLRFLSYFFKEMIFLRTRFFHEEMVQQIKPDIVVTQNVERYLDTVAPDEEAPPFLLYPALKADQRLPSLRFTEALAAVLSYPRPRYRHFLTENGMSDGVACV